MFRIRECTPADFGDVSDLLLQLWPGKPQDREKLRVLYSEALCRSDLHYFCAEQNGSLAGFGAVTIKLNLWQEANLATLDYLVVAEAVRGEGIGHAMLDHSVAIARRNGCSRIEFESALHRTRAHAFYERYGFEKRAYYFTMAV